MPCKDGENARDEEPPCTVPSPTGNGGAGHSESVDQMHSDNDSDEDLQASKKKRKCCGRREFTLMKRWVTGDKAEMDSEDIELQLSELARDWMSQSKLKKLPCHQSKSTNVSLWKQYREYKAKNGSILIRLFRCPFHHRFDALCTIEAWAAWHKAFPGSGFALCHAKIFGVRSSHMPSHMP